MRIIYELDPNEDEYYVRIFNDAVKMQRALFEIDNILRNFDKYLEPAEDPQERINQFVMLMKDIENEVFPLNIKEN